MGSPESGTSLRRASEAPKQEPAGEGDIEVVKASGSDYKENGHRVSPLKLRADSQENAGHEHPGSDALDLPLESEGLESSSGGPPIQAVVCLSPHCVTSISVL